ncbi:NAD(P)/FAD-dependent oxidoreductase [Alloalcanivorax marinus]|uniref:NAD(P)/FAD-dependent oxidoreductase n=1 Tax=Alloalcanivorax marinus TaxID=1177169 RepID=UPI0019324C8D|nr:NAD(P)/FAD-dependent oxidoreductase [Alloalcanivorax marinus]MBL7251181.1 NAD(P)/FAD-dependent oxidoreductase [Alloalcanivorax marinus]
MRFDAIVVGGSYAGMAAALQLVRARRRVLVLDGGQRRNRFASHSQGVLTQDGRDPAAIAADGRAQLLVYPDATWRDDRAARVARTEECFEVITEGGDRFQGTRLILAYGVVDQLPPVSGLWERWGRTVLHCPYCHGYELNRGELGVLATGPMSMHQALLIPEWGPTTFFTNGALMPDADQRAQLRERGVRLEEVPVSAVKGEAEVCLVDGRSFSLAGLFVASSIRPASDLAAQLGCETSDTPMGAVVKTDARQATTVPGVFACGDLARGAGSVSLAIGDGAMAGTATHQSLALPTP